MIKKDIKVKENTEKMDKIISLCKRRGLVYPSSEIYGGFSAVYDYGPYGVELLNNIKNSWWKYMVQYREDIVGLDSSIFMHPKYGRQVVMYLVFQTHLLSAKNVIIDLE